MLRRDRKRLDWVLAVENWDETMRPTWSKSKNAILLGLELTTKSAKTTRTHAHILSSFSPIYSRHKPNSLRLKCSLWTRGGERVSPTFGTYSPHPFFSSFVFELIADDCVWSVCYVRLIMTWDQTCVDGRKVQRCRSKYISGPWGLSALFMRSSILWVAGSGHFGLVGPKKL